jgi:hypothetical protein
VDLLERGSVDIPNPGELGSRVAEDRSRRPAEGLVDLLRCRGLGEIELEERDRAWQGLHGPQLDTDHAALGTDALRQNLKPATGPAAQIDDRAALAQARQPSKQIDQLVRGARAIALRLGAAVE